MEKNREGEELAKSEPSENCIANKEKTPWPEGLGLKKPFFYKYYNKETRDYANDLAKYDKAREEYLFIVNQRHYATECVRCKKGIPLSACSNCGGTQYVMAINQDRILGLCCDNCRLVKTRWICPYCSTDNSILHTFGAYGESSCFIATACAGYNSWEVKILSSFRDEILQGLPKGLVFINLYYRYAPRLVDKISQKPLMLKFFKYLIVQPVAFIIRVLFIRRLNKKVI